MKFKDSVIVASETLNHDLKVQLHNEPVTKVLGINMVKVEQQENMPIEH